MVQADLGPRYQVLSLLGEGAMGQVYLVRHRELGRTEAIKVLKPQVALDERFVARFRREARATNRLNHPNIVAMHDFGRLPDGRFYLSMEYADGKSLASIMREQVSLPFARALRILIQLASAVDHAHSRGVLHRDLKPPNLMLVQHRGKDDVLKVLDFGVSKIISQDYNESIMVSQDGIVFGTPLYMAPEQFYKHPNDPRSDIYAIGCLAYELVTGSPPFTGSIPEVVRAHVETPAPRPGADAPRGDVGAEFDEVVMRCMEKAPAQRYQSAGDLVRDLLVLEPSVHGERRPELDATVIPEMRPLELSEPVSGSTTVIAHAVPDFLVAEVSAPVGDAVRAERNEAVRELAECLLDHGANDARLTIGVADVRAVEHDMAQCEAESRALAVRESRAEQTYREREGMLRFAIGELIFDRDNKATDRPRADLDFQISELETRLAEVSKELEVELERIAEQGIALAARRATLEERRREHYARLSKLVDELSPEFDDELTVAPFLDRYLSMRDLP